MQSKTVSIIARAALYTDVCKILASAHFKLKFEWYDAIDYFSVNSLYQSKVLVNGSHCKILKNVSNLWNMVPWFIIKQTRMKAVITISRAAPPTVLLENSSMVHNQVNADRLRKLSVTFLENVWLWLARTVKMERNRSAHHVQVPNATRK